MVHMTQSICAIATMAAAMRYGLVHQTASFKAWKVSSTASRFLRHRNPGNFPPKNGKPGCWYEYFSQTANQLSKILRINQNKHQKKRASRNKKHIQPNLNIQSNVKSPDARLLMTSRTEASASALCASSFDHVHLQKFVKDQSESNYIWRLSELSVFLEFSSSTFCHIAHMTYIRFDKK